MKEGKLRSEVWWEVSPQKRWEILPLSRRGGRFPTFQNNPYELYPQNYALRYLKYFLPNFSNSRATQKKMLDLAVIYEKILFGLVWKNDEAWL